MSIAMVFEGKGVTQTQYDQARAEVSPDNKRPEGMLFHAGGPTADGWCVVEVWETPEQANRFFEEKLAKAMKRANITIEPKRFDVHNIMK